MSGGMPTYSAGRFDGQHVVITGAGSGIGRATALRVAAEGGRVIAFDISELRLEELAAEGGAAILPVAGDIRNESDIQRVVAAADGRVDALGNIAGIVDGFLALHEVVDDVWDRVFQVNVTGLMRMSRAVLPLMLAQQKGSIVNVSSISGLRGSAAGTAYTASKHAVIGITRSAAFLYALEGIRTNVVAPGSVATSIDADITDASPFARERFLPQRALRLPVAQPEQIAAVIAFLLSDDSSNVNGALVNSDGGWSSI